MSVKHVDSTGKILSYLQKANSKKFALSKLFFRDYTCPSGCGGCCLKFSLDYFPGERWDKFKEIYPRLTSRFVTRKVRGVIVYTDWQKDNNTMWCRYLDLTNGRCKIHQANPFTCEFELIKFMGNNEKSTLIKKLFGRGWQFKRVDGGVGALCEMIAFDPTKIERDIELLKELDSISTKFGITTKLPKVITFLANNLPKLLAGKIPSKNIPF